MEAALAASAEEAEVVRRRADAHEAHAKAKAVEEVEESVAREEAEIEEALRRVEQYVEAERDAMEAQVLFAMSLDEQLIAGMTAEEEQAPEPMSAAAPRMGAASAGGSTAAAPDLTELAERQLAAAPQV